MSEPNQTQAQAAATNGASSAGFVRWLRARLAGSGAKRRPLRVRLKEWFGLGRLIGFGLLLLLFVLRAWDPGPIESLRLKVFDFYQSIQPREVTSNLVSIIDIDEDSMAALGQWPWPRTYLAQIVQNLTAMGAVVIAAR